MVVNYRIPHPQIADTIYASVGDTIFIKNPSNVTEVRYTIDGNDPSEESQLYGSGLIIESEMVLKSRCYINDGRGSSIFTSMIFIK